jgi:peptidoglycan biosynthesis protein MviN/MurJ (putative lipid II flippase)
MEIKRVHVLLQYFVAVVGKHFGVTIAHLLSLISMYFLFCYRSDRLSLFHTHAIEGPKAHMGTSHRQHHRHCL